MESGGGSWPPGQFAGGADGNVNPGDEQMAYQDAFQASPNFFSNNWHGDFGGHPQHALNYASDQYAASNPSNPNAQHHNYSTMLPASDHSFSEVSQHPNYGHEPHPLAYGDGSFQAQTHSQNSYEQHHPQLSMTQPNHSSPPVAGTFVDSSWQNRVSHQPQHQFYQHHVVTPNNQQPSFTPVSHVSTPPPMQSSHGHYSANRSPYQTTPVPAPQSQAPYQQPPGQFSGPFHGQQARVASPLNRAAISHSPAAQVHTTRPMPAAKPATPQSNGPVVGPVATTSVRNPGVGSAGQSQSPGPSAGPFATSLHEASTESVPQPPPTPAFDPISAGFTQSPNYAHLYISDAPVNFSTSQVSVNPDKTFPYSAHTNQSNSVFYPNRPQRLPCEIQRDWDWLAQHEASAAGDTARKQAITVEKAKLDQEMIKLVGVNVKSSKKKIISTRKNIAGESEVSDDDSDHEESLEDQEARRIFNMASRPTDSRQGVKYDIVKIVWRDPNEPPAPNSTAKAIQAFGVTIEKMWSEVKELKAAYKEAKAKKSAKTDSIQSKHDDAMERIGVAVQTALSYGDDPVLENMSGNRKLVIILWNALKTAFASKNLNGDFPKSLLHLLSCFKTLESTFVHDTLKVGETQAKYGKDLEPEMKGYFEQIAKNAKITPENPAKKAEPEKKAKPGQAASVIRETTKPSVQTANKENAKLITKAGAQDTASAIKKPPTFTAKDLASASKKPIATDTRKVTSAPTTLEAKKVSNGTGKAAVSGSPSKRPREDDIDSRVSKKLAVESSASTTTTSSKSPSSAAATKSSAVIQPPSKPRTTILSGKARAAAKPTTKSSSQSSQSSLSQLLSEIEKPKSPPRPVEEPVQIVETPEERKKRLRKESRRHLSVRFKPEAELEEVRYFQHDVTEDEGRASNMVRDAQDLLSEGQLHKRVQLLKKSLGEDHADQADNVDDDDQAERAPASNQSHDGQPKEVQLRGWKEPTSVEFSSIDEGQSEKSYVTRGGKQIFYTNDQTTMDQYEKFHMMAVYASRSDIPETPKSPPPRDSDTTTHSPKIISPPTKNSQFQEGQLRAADTAQHSLKVAVERAIQRAQQASPGRVTKPEKVLEQLLGVSASQHSLHHLQSAAAPASSTFQTSSRGLSQAVPPISMPMSQAERDAEVLKLLNSQAVQDWVDPIPFDQNNPKTKQRSDYDDPQTQADIDAIEVVAAQFAGKAYPAAEPPEHLRGNPAHVKDWQTAYGRDVAAKATRDAINRAQKLRQATQQTMAIPTAQLPLVSQDAQLAQTSTQSLNPQSHQQIYGQPQGYDQQAMIYAQAQALQAQQIAAAQAAYAMSQSSQAQSAPLGGNDQVNALLAALGATQQPAVGTNASAPVNQPSVQDPYAAANAAAWASWYAAQGYQLPQQQQQQLQQQAAYQSALAYQTRDTDQKQASHNNTSNDDGGLDYGSSDYDARDSKGQKGRKDKNQFRTTKDYDHKGINRSLIGTKPCSFWAQGKCAKGDQCTFRHDPKDLQ